MSNNRISQSLTGFDTYIRRVVPYVRTGGPPTNGTRLGLSAQQLTDCQDFLDLWWTGIPATPGAYELHSNPDTKTKTTRTRVVTIIKNFTTFFSPLLTGMSVNAALTDSDRQNLNLPARDTTSTPRGQINDMPTVNVSGIGGGRMKIRTRVSSDASRASMHPLADAVEMRYQIGGTQPANAAACPDNAISKKALFTFDAGDENAGQKFFGFFRYVNFTNPENNGPWSSGMTAPIS